MKLVKFIFSRTFLKNLAIIAVVSCAIIGGLYLYLHIYTGHGETVEVPGVDGMRVDEAGLVFGDVGLSFLVVDSVYSQEGQVQVIYQWV